MFTTLFRMFTCINNYSSWFFRKFIEAKLCLRARVLDCSGLDALKPILDLWTDLEARWGMTCSWQKCSCPTCEMEKIKSCNQTWWTQSTLSNNVCRYIFYVIVEIPITAIGNSCMSVCVCVQLCVCLSMNLLTLERFDLGSQNLNIT